LFTPPKPDASVSVKVIVIPNDDRSDESIAAEVSDHELTSPGPPAGSAASPEPESAPLELQAARAPTTSRPLITAAILDILMSGSPHRRRSWAKYPRDGPSHPSSAGDHHDAVARCQVTRWSFGALMRSPPPREPFSPAADSAGAEVSSGNWSFTRVPAGDDRPMLALMQKKAAAQGYTLVDASSGDWPVVEVANTTGVPLRNPQVELYFTDFGVMGGGFDYVSGVNERESLNLHAGSAAQLTKRATIKLTGVISPQETHQFALSGGVDSFYQTGGSPSVRMVLSADNAEDVETSYGIKVR
jgi:hypothetical protein